MTIPEEILAKVQVELAGGRARFLSDSELEDFSKRLGASYPRWFPRTGASYVSRPSSEFAEAGCQEADQRVAAFVVRLAADFAVLDEQPVLVIWDNPD
jgi:hypothetical protein